MGAQLSSSNQSSERETFSSSWILVVLEFSNWRERLLLREINKVSKRIADSTEYYRWLSLRLSIERCIYVPLTLLPGETWSQLFFDLYALRNLWTLAEIPDLLSPSTQKKVQDRFKINVYAKFRPHESMPVSAEDVENDVEVTLPLHQRLQMIKMSRGIQSNRQALKVLASEGEWFRVKWNALAIQQLSPSKRQVHYHNGGTDEEFVDRKEGQIEDKNYLNIENQKESFYNLPYLPTQSILSKPEKMVAKVQAVDPGTGRVVVVAPDVGLREFSFDGVFQPTTSQKHLYETTCRRLVRDLVNGFNATCIVYGQTGSGKSYTMFGSDEQAIGNSDHHGSGIVPRACREIFTAIRERSESANMNSRVAISYVEVFGDQISDLLRNGARCGQSKVAAQQFVLQGAAEHLVSSMEDIRQALLIGEAQKRHAATAMNERSSRAHAIFILSLTQTNRFTNISRTSKLFLADLGGSEQVKKSQVEAGGHRPGLETEFSAGFQLGDHMREAVYINLGLLALKKCIEALNTKANYIPYQDSKLTMLLSSGLGGNSKTSIIVCSRLESSHVVESVATLRFGEKCALIENELSAESAMLANVLKNIDEQIKTIEAEIVTKEQWIDVVEIREDILAEDGTIEKAGQGMEKIKVSKLVGAEKERKELEILLKKRAQFTGTVVFDEEVNEMSSSANSIESNSSQNRKKKIIFGFGRELAETYGIGEKFNEAMEEQVDNSRFAEEVEKEFLPSTVSKGWVAGEAIAEDQRILEQRAVKTNRNKLRYAGISA